MMDSVPVRNGKKCVYRVVRVSGTIRKAEEEAIRRAREMIMRARRQLGDQSGASLEGILGKADADGKPGALESDVLMLDASDDGEGGYSDDEGD